MVTISWKVRKLIAAKKTNETVLHPENFMLKVFSHHYETQASCFELRLSYFHCIIITAKQIYSSDIIAIC